MGTSATDIEADLTSLRRPASLTDFFRMRNAGDTVLLDRLTTNNVAFVFAFLGDRAGLTPNQFTLFSGLLSAAAFVASFVMPVDQAWFSVLVIFALAQTAYMFDCADGQLARCTNRTSEYGAFLDKGIDVLGGLLAIGAVFIFLYRHFAAVDQAYTAKLVLICGFVFLATRTARLNVAQNFVAVFGAREEKAGRSRTSIEEVLVSVTDIQMSLFAMLVATVSVSAALSIFALQSALQMLAYFRYFGRARCLTGD